MTEVTVGQCWRESARRESVLGTIRRRGGHKEEGHNQEHISNKLATNSQHLISEGGYTPTVCIEAWKEGRRGVTFGHQHGRGKRGGRILIFFLFQKKMSALEEPWTHSSSRRERERERSLFTINRCLEVRK